MSAQEQLYLDLTPVGAVGVGARVRVIQAASSFLAGRLVGREGTVVGTRPPCPPGSTCTWLPVLVLLDGDQPGREYAFEHEALEVIGPATEAVPS